MARQTNNNCLRRTKIQKEIDSDFSSGTTCHGFWRLIGSTHGLQKVFWAVFIIAAFCLTSWQIILQFVAYYSYGTATQIVVQENPSLTFPAVTICNFNTYQKSLLTPAERYAVEAGSMLFSDVEDAMLPGFDVGAYLSNMSHLFPNGFDIAAVTRKAGWKLDNETLLHCKFNGQQCSTNDFWHTFTTYGSCYQFNKNKKYIQYLSGSGNGLQIMLNIKESEYTSTLLWSGNVESGLRLHVHPQHEAPDVLSKGISVGPGLKAYVAARTYELRNAKKPWGECDPKRRLKYFPFYSKSGCILECKDRLVNHNCQCKILHFPGKYPVCDPQQTANCARNLLSKIRQNMTSYCGHCVHGCREISHPIQMSYSSIPNSPISDSLASYIGLNSSSIRRNVVMLDVFYEDLRIYVTEIYPAMTVGSLLSNVGGQLGLFIGLSVGTLFEFIEYGIIRLLSFFRLRGASYRKQLPKPTKKGHNESLVDDDKPSSRKGSEMLEMLKHNIPDS
ncbi:bile acid-sensitive ion channel-like [Tubulanus polymorphus]|uniref:bile acid-sensitive ion channel-like n=1 Tax=Tubulanus polymorphus TaxID=672921 RepID=UPI003DA41660